MILQMFDFIDQGISLCSTLSAISAFIIAVYWCSLSYGLLITHRSLNLTIQVYELSVSGS